MCLNLDFLRLLTSTYSGERTLPNLGAVRLLEASHISLILNGEADSVQWRVRVGQRSQSEAVEFH